MIPLIVKIFLSDTQQLVLFNIDFGKIISFFPGSNLTFKLIFMTIAAFSLKFFLYIYFSKYEVHFYRDLKSHFSQKLFTSYVYKNYLFFLNINSSAITRNIVNESENAVQFVVCSIVLLKEILLVSVISFMLILYDPITSILSLILILFITYAFYLFSHKTLKEIATKRIMGIGALYKMINETFSLIKEVKVMEKENYFINKFATIRNFFDQKISQRDFIMKLPKIFFEYVSIMALCSLILYFTYIGKQKSDLFVILSLLTIAIVRLMPSFNQISGSLAHYGSYKESFLILQNEIINTENSTTFKNNKINYSDNSNQELEIKFENVSYDYGDDKNDQKQNIPTLKNISFEIRKGEFIGIIGKSGSGKSTLINLILGLLTPKNGQIIINNFRTKIGYVPQDIYLIDDTIKANIALGSETHEIDIPKINQVLRESELESFIRNKKEGIDLILGDRGVKISGGEKQRVGLARALYDDKNIIIFDEATSSLDNQTEQSIMKSIINIKKKQSKSLTIIMIAHRLSSLVNCDKVILLEKGHIKDIDKLEVLMKKFPEYRNSKLKY